MAVKQPHAELEQYLDRRSMAFRKAYLDLLESYGNGDRWRINLERLASIMRGSLMLSELNGRRRALLIADAVKRKTARFASADPGIPFEEAIDDLVSREPRLIQSAQEVALAYSKEKVFAMAYSSSLKLTDRVQDIIARIERHGGGEAQTQQQIIRIAKEEGQLWTVSYSSLVYRTNLNHVYTNGLFKQAQDPDVAEVIPAMEFSSERDERTRPNHSAADGFIASTDDPVWRWLRPPLGYSCRCGCNFVSVFELERRGLIRGGRVIRYEPPDFGNAAPDDGFKPGVF